VLGRLVPHKQVEHALEVLATLAGELPDLRMDVIGEGWWHPQLTAHAERLGVTDRVTFHGHVSDTERDRLLDEAWLLLAPSVKEGWGIAIMEAAARAVPALGYRTAGGVTESIQDGETGLLVADPAELTERTRDLLADTEARLAMGKKARERARNFGWDASAARFEQLILTD
jgi:glycosyltransferase involved in cell wall biosynthesis